MMNDKIANGLVTVLGVSLAGCAGSAAMQWRKPETPCGVLVCEAPIGESKVVQERDCRCSGKSASQVLQEIMR